MSAPPTAYSSEPAAILAKELGSENISENRADKINYARDLWPLDTIRLQDGIVSPMPDVIAWPLHEYHILKILEIARRFKIPVIPFGAGSGVCGGTVPILGGIILDMKKMNRIVRVDEKSMIAEIETGIIGEILERELNRQGFTLGHFPSSIYCSTLGGWLAARSAGQLSSKYGKIEDRVLAVRAVLSNGEAVETIKSPRHAIGPDWVQAIVGSEGTFAIITKASMKLSPLPEAREFHSFDFPDLSSGIDAVRNILQGGVKPAACRLYDPVDTLIASRGKSAVAEGAKRESILGRIIERLHRAPMDIPREMLPRLLDKPKFLNDLIGKRARKCRLVLSFEGPARLVKIEHKRASQFCERCGGIDLGAEPAQTWWKHRYAVSYGLSTVFDLGLFVDTMEVATSWSNLENLYNNVMKTIRKHALAMAHFSHAYPQGCNIYFTFAAGASHPMNRAAKYNLIWNEALDAVVKNGGILSHHHGIGLLKRHFYEAQQGHAMKIVRGLKRAFDPDGILNPGKMGL